MSGFLSYGMAKGLSNENPWDKDIENLYKHQAYVEGIRQVKAQKVQQHAELTKEHAAASPYYQEQLEGFYNELNKKMGKFIMDNPGFEYDPVRYKEYLKIADQYINNEFVREDLTSRSEIDKFRQAASKKGELSLMDIEKNEQAIKAFNESGTPYRFIADNSPKFEDIVVKGQTYLNNSLKKTQVEKGFKTITDVNLEPHEVRTYAEMVYADPEQRDVIEARWEQSGQSYDTPTDYLEAVFNNGLAIQHLEQLNAAYRASVSNQEDPPREPFTFQLLRELAQRGKVKGNPNLYPFAGIDEKKEIHPDGNIAKNITVRGEDENGKTVWSPYNFQNIIRIGDIQEVFNEDGMTYMTVTAHTELPMNMTNNYEYSVIDRSGKQVTFEDGSTKKYFKSESEAITWENNNRDQFNLPRKEDKRQRTLINLDNEKAKLLKAGFREQGEYEPGIMGGMPMESRKSSHMKYIGYIKIPVTWSESNSYLYDKAMGGVEHARKVNFNMPAIIYDQAKQGNKSNVRSIVNSYENSYSGFDFIPELEPEGAKNTNLFALKDEAKSSILVYNILDGTTDKVLKGTAPYNRFIQYLDDAE